MTGVGVNQSLLNAIVALSLYGRPSIAVWTMQAVAVEQQPEKEMKMTLDEFKKSLAAIDKQLRPFPATAQVFTPLC